ncbi:uncharacterized protein LOC103714899 isoform X2 [Phoenix dactylifera]|uniref:Uncharacterized protein LOC103714899 isoform X2 n=1 Tax=Phoenix dactylifera TaxID=42345 RepID=A0A8B7CJH8_PHODC|nr:uncharacterized protein LOC103714899 isoform X2 [Phoenix dactylifera]
MIGKKAVLTYKRKRFSSQSRHGDGITADSYSRSSSGVPLEISSQEAESGADNEKLNKCNACIPQEKWQCSTCVHEFEESMQKQVRETNKTKKNKSIEDSEIRKINLQSHKMLLSARPSGDSSTKTSSSANDASLNKIKNITRTDDSYTDSDSACKVTCIEGNSRSKDIDLGIVGRSSSICLGSLTERKNSSGLAEGCVSVLLNSDKRSSVICNVKHPKENCNTPLITFSRRVKKKQGVGEKFMGGNLRAEQTQCSTGTWSNSQIGPSCRCEGSTQNCSFMDRSTKVVLPEQADCSPLHVVQQAMIADVGKDAAAEPAPEVGAETKSAGETGEKLSLRCSEIPEKPNLSHRYPLPSQPAGHVPEDPSEKLAAAYTTGVIRDSILVHESRGSVSSGNKLVNTIKSSDKAITLSGISKDRSHLGNLEFSVSLPASTSPTNIESSKSSLIVMPENLLKCQSLSTRSCGIVMADKETDGKVDELKWLETLQKELQVTNKGKNICSSVEQSVINCQQASNGRASPMVPVSLSAQSPHDQDASREFKNQTTGSQERAFLTKSVETDYEKQKQGETTDKSSFSAGFLGLPLNLEGPDVSVKNFQSMHSSLNFSIKDSVHEFNKTLPWPSINENTSVSKQKQIADNVKRGSQMLEERPASLLDKFKRNANEWSEEELDFLWIGVRRYGVNNWNAMLRDPKLCFMKSRVAEDLAERWNLEQRKLLNGTLFQPGRPSGPELLPFTNDSWVTKLMPSNYYGGNGAWSARSEFPTLTAEPKLSLGGIYLQIENTLKRNPLHSLGLGTVNPLTSASLSPDSISSSFPVGSSYPGSGISHQKSFNAHNTRYDYESSSARQKSVEILTQDHQTTSLPASSNLPHWLRDVVIPQPKPSNLTLPPISLSHSASMLNNDPRVDPPAPPKDSRRRGILKRKNITSGNQASSARVSDNPASMNEHQVGNQPAVLPTLGVISQTPTPVNTSSNLDGVSNLNKKSSCPAGPSNLVVIDSEASSEETISDS